MRHLFVVAILSDALTVNSHAASVLRKIESTGDLRLDDILSSVTWDTKVFTYAFHDAPSLRQAQEIEFAPLSAPQRELARATLRQIETFTSLHFLETSGTAEALLTYAQWNGKSRLGRADAKSRDRGASVDYVDTRGQTWISSVDAKLTDLSPGGYASRWWMHETGHIFGLEHTHNNFANTPLPAEYDNMSNTLMTYRLSGEIVLHMPHGNFYPTTYMPLDMFALQHLYGANLETNAKDRIYRFSPDSDDYFAGSARVASNPDGKLFLTLWDGGGSDTLDFTAYSQNGIYDMRPGRFSAPSPAQRVEFNPGDFAEGSIGMPLLPKGDQRALIENIIVGNGDNKITAHEAANMITLGAGANRIAFHPGSRKDVVAGFGEDDALDLSGYRVPVAMVHVAQEGEDTIVTIDQWPADEIRVVKFTASPHFVLR